MEVNVLKHFGNIKIFYNNILEESVSDQVHAGILEQIVGKDFYNYLLIDGEKFFAIMERYGPDCQEITNQDFKELKGCCFYSGKGKNFRKLMHVKRGKRLFEKKMKFKKISAKFSKICRIWEMGHGIICLQFLIVFSCCVAFSSPLW